MTTPKTAPAALNLEAPVKIQVLSDMREGEGTALVAKFNATRTVIQRGGRFTLELANNPGEHTIYVEARNNEIAWLLKGYAWAIWEAGLAGRDW